MYSGTVSFGSQWNFNHNENMEAFFQFDVPLNIDIPEK